MIMRVLPIWVLLFLLVGLTSSDFVDEEPVPQNDDHTTPDYDRLDEVRKSCSSIIASGFELKLDDDGINRIKNELSFLNGDWEQLGNTAPLMPFDERSPMMGFDGGYDPFNLSHPKSPYKLVSFKLTDVSTPHQSRKTIGVNGYLNLVITSNLPLATMFNRRVPEFSMWRGHTRLFINFQGVYTESKKNGGERILCLLGNTMLPSRQPDSTDPWESVKGSGSSDNSPPLLQDDQILLVLSYPKIVSLKHSAIQGEMRSLNSKTNLKYFDKVQITSQVQGHAQNYDFSPEEIISKACDPYPYPDTLLSRSNEIYKGLDFCTAFKRVSTDAAFVVAPHWRCNDTDEFCRKFGPFGSDKEINGTDGSFKDVRILIQNVLCVTEKTHDNGVTSSRVSAVFRAFDAPDNLFIEIQRSGLGNMTLFAEGVWNSSSGQLCMIGCLGIADVGGHGCDSRVCLYIPLTFSITQRSVLLGSISSIQFNNPPYFPLSLQMLYQSLDYIYDSYTYSHPYYRYSKIGSAGAVLEKNEPFSFGTVIKKPLLTFPKLQDSEDYHESLRLLAEDLTLHVTAVPDPIPSSRFSRTNVEMEVLALGPMFGRDWYQNNSLAEKETPYHTKATYTENQLLLNVSTQLKFKTGHYGNFSVLFLEGLYDQHVGKMYMIGCRDVRAPWNLLYESMDLEDGLDCLIEVVVSYPPTTARWLTNPSAMISVSSKRAEDDPLYFNLFKLQTLSILYRQQREEILSRRGFEGILRILALSLAIGCILSQLLYTRNVTDSVPYMSLVMLGSQVIGYALPLVFGAKALSRRNHSGNSEMISYDLDYSQWIHVIDYTVKLLVLVCFILTLRLSQKVWRSRVKLLSQNPNDPHRVPTEKHVLFITLIVHVIGYVSALVSHSVKTRYVDETGNPRALQTWETLFQEYIGVLQDLSLLPQVIGNIIWQINSKPLRKLYYLGITVVRLLPHVYDYIRGPVSNPFFSEEYEFVNQRFDFYSEVGDIAIPVLAVTLAGIVYIQQKWNYEKLSNTLTLGRFRILPFRSRMYERLPSLSVESETELVSGPVKHDVQESEK